MNRMYKLVVGIRGSDSAFIPTQVLSPLYFESLDLKLEFATIRKRVLEQGQ